MNSTQSVKVMGTVTALAAIALGGMFRSSLRAQDRDDNEALLAQRGFEIAPVPLNLAGKNPVLVGLGSYIVNGASDCNSCHNGGGPPNFDFAKGRNPYFGQPKKLDPKVYLSGGQDFGAVGPPDNTGQPTGPHIISRNLTPDKAGRAEGGHTLEEFIRIMRTGVDMDHLHPTCSGGITSNCVPAPVDGNVLQIMPWGTFQNMTDHHLQAIYEYLSAIPCIDTKVAGQPQLRNNCH